MARSGNQSRGAGTAARGNATSASSSGARPTRERKRPTDPYHQYDEAAIAKIIGDGTDESDTEDDDELDDDSYDDAEVAPKATKTAKKKAPSKKKQAAAVIPSGSTSVAAAGGGHDGMTTSQLSSMTTSQLKAEANSRGLDDGGSKEALISRLVRFDQYLKLPDDHLTNELESRGYELEPGHDYINEDMAAALVDDDDLFCGYLEKSEVELKSLCTGQGLSSNGTKPVLAARFLSYRSYTEMSMEDLEEEMVNRGINVDDEDDDQTTDAIALRLVADDEKITRQKVPLLAKPYHQDHLTEKNDVLSGMADSLPAGLSVASPNSLNRREKDPKIPLLRGVEDINDKGRTGKIMKRSLAGNRAQSVLGDGRLMSGTHGEGSKLAVEALKKKFGSRCSCLRAGVADGFEEMLRGSRTARELTDENAISCDTCRVVFHASKGSTEVFIAAESSPAMKHISSDYHQFYEEIGGKPDTDEKHLRALVKYYGEELGCAKTTVPRNQATHVKCACGSTYKAYDTGKGLTRGSVRGCLQTHKNKWCGKFAN